MSNVRYVDLVMGADTRGLLKGKHALEATTKAGANTDNAVRRVDGRFKKAGDTADKASTKVDKFSKATDRTKGAAAAASKSLGVMTAAVGAAASAAATLAGATRIIREFDSSMSQVAAITRATASEMEAMRDIAKELGRTTEFTSAQAADGLKFLGMAGFEASEGMAALPAVLDLATAAAMDLGSAADIASNIMSGFGNEAGEASTVADILAAASSRANTSVQQLGGAMSTVAPIAAALEIDLADTAAAISAMSDAGIQGERAGTALRGVLASLAGPTKQATDALSAYGLTAAQVDPQAHSLAEIFTTLRERGLSTADAMTIFGREAASGALVLVEASGRIGDFAQNLREAEGAAGDMADTMRDNLGGDAKAAASALEGLAIAVGEAGLAAVLRGALGAATGLARGLTALVEAVSGFFSAHDPAVQSVVAMGVAMKEEATQALAVSTRLQEMGQVSYDVLGAKIALLETTLRGIDADREDARSKIMQGEAYQALQGKVDAARETLATFRDIALRGGGMSPELSEDMERIRGNLEAAVAEQERLLSTVSETSPEYNKIVAEIDLLKAYLADADGEMVNLGDNANEVGNQLSFAERVAAALEGYIVGSGNAAGGAAQNASALSGAFLSAAQSALGLYRALSSAMGVLGAVGGGLSRLASNVGGVVGATSQLGGVLGNVLGGSAMQSAISHIADAGKNLSYMHGAAVRAAPGIEELNKSLSGSKSGGGSSGGTSKAAKDAAREAEKFAKEVERLEFDADPLKKYNEELERLEYLVSDHGLSDGAFQHAVAELNDEFANSDPMISKAGDAIADLVAGSLRGFDDLLGAFKSMLKEMIATAIANPIKLALMGVSGGMAGTAAQAAGAAPGGGGMLGGLLGGVGSGIGTLASAASTGLMSSVGGFMSGGLSGGVGAIGAQLSATAAGGFGLSSVAASIGAVAAPLLAVAAAINFFKKKTEILDSGIRIMAEGMDLTLLEFEKVKTSRFWGLSKKVGMEIEELSEETEGPLEKAIMDIQSSVLDAADALGFASSTFDDFSISIDAATRGLSDEEAQAKIAEVLGNFANNFANMIPGLDAFTTEGTNMHEVLLRIVNSLNTTNAAFEQLGFSLFEMSLDGAAAAEAFIGIFGSLDNMVSASSAYYQRFYTDTERVTNATDNMRAALADLGLVMPATIEGFRALVEQAEAMGQTQRVAQLINLSGAFAGMNDGQTALQDKAAQDLQAAFAREMEATRAASQAAISGLQDSLTGARERLASSRAIANALESALQSRVFPSVEAERQAQDRAAEYLRSLVEQAEINDRDALQAALQAVANPSADTYATLEYYRRDFDRTSGVIAELERTASTALTADEQMVSLLEQQISAAENAADRQIDLMQAQLDALLGIGEQMSLEDAIANFEAAQAAAAASPNTGDPIEKIYQDVLGRSADAAGLAFYRGLLNSGALTVSQIRADIAGSNEAITGVVPSFAGGGHTGRAPRSGGLDGKGGFMAILHPRETVTDHTRGGNGKLEALVAQLAAKVDELTAINRSTARHTRKSADIAQKWDDIGTPGSAEGAVVKTEAAT